MYPEFDCIDCGTSTFQKEYYMVWDRLWEKAGMDKGMLCIDCLENRLGHRLEVHDFTYAPVNYVFFAKNAERFPGGFKFMQELDRDFSL